MDSTIAAIATPPGVGGIAVVRISGSEAYSVANKVFMPANKNNCIKKAKGYSAIYGKFLYKGIVYDDVIALCFRAPKSYTGEDVVEISCHGGSAVSERLLRACLESGAHVAQNGEFTKRAFLNGRITLTQAEAVIDMINAETTAGVRAAAQLIDGALYKKISSIKSELLTLSGHISAFADYPEEDIPQLSNTQIVKVLVDANTEITKLIENYDSGKFMRRGITASIIGSPNVGKSTLLNLLSGFERAIVTPIAGTTRDIVEQEVILDDIKLILSDTAGIRQTDDDIEKEGIKRTHKQINSASVLLAVFDLSRKINKHDIELANLCKNKQAIAILNKSDLQQKFDVTPIENCFSRIISISANSTDSLQTIKKAVVELLKVNMHDTDSLLLANERQLKAANMAKAAIDEALFATNSGLTTDAVGVCLSDALSALYSLTGENATDEIINEVFSKFCVGK